MLNFFVSKALSEAMAPHLSSQPVRTLGTMRWFAHSVPVSGGHCTLLMEDRTRYCSIFHNLKSADFVRFPELFRNRLRKEVTALCQQPPQAAQQLDEIVQRSCADYQFSLGLDYDASADLFDSARELQAIIEELGGYPVIGVTEFGIGIKINQRSRVALHEKREFTPLHEFRQFWLSKLNSGYAQPTPTPKDKGSNPPNVLKFDQTRDKR